MLYQLPNGRVIEISTEQYFEMSDEELEYLIANLFFETRFSNIIYYLKRNSLDFNNLITPPFKEYTSDSPSILPAI